MKPQEIIDNAVANNHMESDIKALEQAFGIHRTFKPYIHKPKQAPHWYNTGVYLKRGSWKDNTDHELDVPFKMLIQSRSTLPNPYDPESYSGRYYGCEYWNTRIVVRVKFERRASRKLIKEALSRYFTTQGGCGHSYDCCGCVSNSAYESNIKHLKRNEWEIIQGSSVNC